MESNQKILHYEVIEHTDLNEKDSKYSEKMWKHRNPNWKPKFIISLAYFTVPLLIPAILLYFFAFFAINSILENILDSYYTITH